MFGFEKSKAQLECDAWNKKYAGKPIKTKLVDGYNVISKNTLRTAGIYSSEDIRVDRLAWFVQTGKWPEKEVIHINGDKADDRWVNLRLAD